MKNSIKCLSIAVLSLLLGGQCSAMKGMTDKTQGNIQFNALSRGQARLLPQYIFPGDRRAIDIFNANMNGYLALNAIEHPYASQKPEAKKRREIGKETVALIRTLIANGMWGLQDAIVYGRRADSIDPNDYKESERHNLSFINQTTIDAAIRFCKEDPKNRVGVLNFANAFDIGGGFPNGAIAQEEEIIRCSTWLASLISQEAREGYYGPNRQGREDYISRRVLVSPHVMILRDGQYNILQNQYDIVGIAAAAFNWCGSEANILLDKRINIADGTKTVIRNAIKAAIDQRCNTLILGAFGCGAFGNSPRDIANCFKEVLYDEGLFRFFKNVTFAIPCGSDPYNMYHFGNMFKASNLPGAYNDVPSLQQTKDKMITLFRQKLGIAPNLDGKNDVDAVEWMQQQMRLDSLKECLAGLWRKTKDQIRADGNSDAEKIEYLQRTIGETSKKKAGHITDDLNTYVNSGKSSSHSSNHSQNKH